MCPTGTALRPRDAAKPSRLKPAFDVIDADRDGKISRDDLRAFYAGRRASEHDDDVIGTMISVADFNKDGYVEYDEFERVLDLEYGKANSKSKSNGGGGLMEDVFKVMDKDGDGRLSHNDLKSYMKCAGFAATDDDIKAMIRLGGGDETDGVSFDGLLKILAVDTVA
ncbi:hypothetical protein WN943_028369 [Citrus x changshan-huyou]